jgi:hypothetical protein
MTSSATKVSTPRAPCMMRQGRSKTKEPRSSTTCAFQSRFLMLTPKRSLPPQTGQGPTYSLAPTSLSFAPKTLNEIEDVSLAGPLDRAVEPDAARRHEAASSEMSVFAKHRRSFLSRFIAYPSEHAKIAHVLWVAHAHLMGAWESTPRIAYLSPEPGSGKTRTMEVTELLVPNPVCAVNVTPAYLFRKVGGEAGLPTILFDEIDTVFGPKARENEELRALLNSGHRRGAVAGRCVVRGKIVETEEIPSFAPVALAGLGWLPDTILSRSIVVRMRRRAPDEPLEAFRRRTQAPIGEALRRRLAAWAEAVLQEATEARPEMPAGVEDRNADVWEPLLAVADLAGLDWPKLARRAAVELVKAAREIEPSLNIRLLADLRTIFEGEESLSTKDVLARLCSLEDAPWNDLKGKPISDRQLSQRLGGMGSSQRRFGSAPIPRGATRAPISTTSGAATSLP